MPLIILSGYPASGKSERAEQLKNFFCKQNKIVHIVSENVAIPNAGYCKNEYFSDSQKEKLVRSDLKSEALRLLNKNDIVILDASNYIKGYRYELFCATKSARCTQCTLFCAIQKERAWSFNQQRTSPDTLPTDDAKSKIELFDNCNVPYDRCTFDALCMRYEEPHGNARWDSPLYVVFPDDPLPLKEIYDSLYEAQPKPPNQSTQNPPLSTTNYLFELDRSTQQIITDILTARKIGIVGPITVQDSTCKVDIPETINAIQLNKLRRQFLNYRRLHQGNTGGLDRTPKLFVQFLNINCCRPNDVLFF